MKQIVSSAVHDAAAKGVAKAWDLEVETCDMHDGDKVGLSAVGRLISKDGRGSIVIPFSPGQELERKLNAQAKHSSLSHTNCQWYKEIIHNENNQDLPATMIKKDLCGTWMNSFHGLL
eukprot:350099-Ditylum_brightwellii.AAC.1